MLNLSPVIRARKVNLPGATELQTELKRTIRHARSRPPPCASDRRLLVAAGRSRARIGVPIALDRPGWAGGLGGGRDRVRRLFRALLGLDGRFKPSSHVAGARDIRERSVPTGIDSAKAISSSESSPQANSSGTSRWSGSSSASAAATTWSSRRRPSRRPVAPAALGSDRRPRAGEGDHDRARGAARLRGGAAFFHA